MKFLLWICTGICLHDWEEITDSYQIDPELGQNRIQERQCMMCHLTQRRTRINWSKWK